MPDTNETPTATRLSPRDHPLLLDFAITDDCDNPKHGDDATGSGACVGCLRDEAADYFKRNHEDEWSGYANASVEERRVEAEIDWLFRRIKQLSWIRQRDPFYYFHGHKEMIEPKRVKNQPEKRAINSATRLRTFARDRYRCTGCGTWEALSVDHIVPESRGGSHEDDNLQTLCKPCNSSKGTKSQTEWEAWRNE